MQNSPPRKTQRKSRRIKRREQLRETGGSSLLSQLARGHDSSLFGARAFLRLRSNSHFLGKHFTTPCSIVLRPSSETQRWHSSSPGRQFLRCRAAARDSADGRL